MAVAVSVGRVGVAVAVGGQLEVERQRLGHRRRLVAVDELLDVAVHPDAVLAADRAHPLEARLAERRIGHHEVPHLAVDDDGRQRVERAEHRQLAHLASLEPRPHLDEADRVEPEARVPSQPDERVEALGRRPADEGALGGVRPHRMQQENEGEARQHRGRQEEEEVDDRGVAAGRKPEQPERQVAGDRAGAARAEQHAEARDARDAPRRPVDAEQREGAELRARHERDRGDGRRDGHFAAARQGERAGVRGDDEHQVDDDDERPAAREPTEDRQDQVRPRRLQLVEAEGLDEPDDRDADAERHDVDRPARDARHEVGERGRAGGGHVEEEDRAALAEAEVEQPMMDVPAVRPRRVLEAVRQPFPEEALAPRAEAAREKAARDGERGVGGGDRDQEERGERRHDRPGGARERQHGQGVADHQAARVAEEDAGRVEVVGKEPEDRRAEDERRGRRGDVAGVHRRRGHPEEADEPDARREAVQAVGQVEGVGDQHDPHTGQDGVEERRAEHGRVPEAVEPEPAGDREHGGGRLGNELRLGAERPDVVDHADDQQERRAGEDERPEVCRGAREHEADRRGQRDGDPARPRRRPRVHAARVRHVGGTAQEREPAHHRRGGERDQERGCGRGEDHAASA